MAPLASPRERQVFAPSAPGAPLQCWLVEQRVCSATASRRRATSYWSSSASQNPGSAASASRAVGGGGGIETQRQLHAGVELQHRRARGRVCVARGAGMLQRVELPAVVERELRGDHLGGDEAGVLHQRGLELAGRPAAAHAASARCDPAGTRRRGARPPRGHRPRQGSPGQQRARAIAITAERVTGGEVAGERVAELFFQGEPHRLGGGEESVAIVVDLHAASSRRGRPARERR